MTKLFFALCAMVTCSLLLGDETISLAAAESIAQPAVADNIIDSAGFQVCKEGFKGVGPICLEICPDGYDDKGVFCIRNGSEYAKKSRVATQDPCPDGMRDDGLSCWLDTYGRGIGRAPDKTPCPAGLRDDGTSCWSDAHIYGKGCCCTIFGCCNKCRTGYHDDGCTCRKTHVGIKITLFQRQSCQSSEEKHGALCYPKCKDGYHPVGCCLCEPDDGPGIKLTLLQRQSGCNKNEVNIAGICWERCKPGFNDDGAFCRDSFKKKSYGRGKEFPIHRLSKNQTQVMDMEAEKRQ